MKLFLIAGEPSGDKLGAALIEGLRRLQPNVEVHGIGGPLMQAQGLKSQFPMEELSVMGLAEVLPRLRGLLRRRDETAEAVAAGGMDALITIDSPDFCLRVAKKVKARTDIPTIHYVAPTVWAWRPKRANKMAGVIDHVLALFPFEPPYMERAGMSCAFTGHPVATEPRASADEIALFRRELGLGAAPVLLALPGSRRGEVSRLLSPFEGAVRQLCITRPQTRIVIPAAEPVADLVRTATLDWPGDPVILDPRAMPPDEALFWKRAAFGAADVALAASGTVSLELAASDTPMVVAYDMNWLTRQIVKRMLLVKTVTLVNLVAGLHAVPEFLGADCTPEKIAPALDDLFDNQQSREVQLAAFQVTMEKLGRGGEDPGQRAARSVLETISRLKSQ